jgi:serine/threonine-protein kinase
MRDGDEAPGRAGAAAAGRHAGRDGRAQPGGAERGALDGGGEDDRSRRGDATPRQDTIALVERAAAPRDVPRRAAIAIIVGLSILAGAGAYAARAARSPAGAASATAAPSAAPATVSTRR